MPQAVGVGQEGAEPFKKNMLASISLGVLCRQVIQICLAGLYLFSSLLSIQQVHVAVGGFLFLVNLLPISSPLQVSIFVRKETV